jgi:hypothetical protein
VVGACRLDPVVTVEGRGSTSTGTLYLKFTTPAVMTITLSTLNTAGQMQLYYGAFEADPMSPNNPKEFLVTMVPTQRSGLPPATIYHLTPTTAGSYQVSEIYKRPDGIYCTWIGDYALFTTPMTNVSWIAPDGEASSGVWFLSLNKVGWWTFIRTERRRTTLTWVLVYPTDDPDWEVPLLP